jgi:serine/threonine protein kinase
MIVNDPLRFKSSRKRITEELKDFLRKLLEKDPNDRMDLLTAKDHPWF